MKKKQGLIALGLAVLLVIGSLAAYRCLAPKARQGSKTITVNVDHLVGDDTTFVVSTDAEYLRAALEQEGLIAGVEAEYGLWLTTVDGETADESEQQWWGYDVNGEMALYGVDEQVVTDGDVYDFTLNVGW